MHVRLIDRYCAFFLPSHNILINAHELLAELLLRREAEPDLGFRRLFENEFRFLAEEWPVRFQRHNVRTHRYAAVAHDIAALVEQHSIDFEIPEYFFCLIARSAEIPRAYSEDLDFLLWLLDANHLFN